MSQEPTTENVVEDAVDMVAPEEAREVAASSDQSSADPEGDTDQVGEGAGADEGEVAADYLEELLDIADLDGDIEIEIRSQRTFISIHTEEGTDELQRLVGHKGEVLDALQELTRLAVLTATGRRSSLILDINGHRAQRQSELQAMADEAAQEIHDSGQKVHLEPMSAFERKLVHDFVAEAGLVSESEGEGKRRHVVVHPSE